MMLSGGDHLSVDLLSFVMFVQERLSLDVLRYCV